ncbi:O-antigen ligase family protein [Arthrobacter gengyunqii]|uniref:O-antigen ligase family protein n=1 Tax=Arthrobacter gengyunqii TaxID=2886940 RepID=A0ABS8GJM5_9MICC|nr:O-antigen ligase family protein [Arthrobacter gengyunqii]MCC3266570.1 O-antigen ligase family protein [Arthrobacter gengyunqii]
MIWFLLAAVIVGGILALPLMPLGLLLFGGLLIRTLSDVGASSTGSLLPSSLISVGIGLAFIVMVPVPQKYKLSNRKQVVICCLCAVLIASSFVSLSRYGSVINALSEPIRVISLVAIFVLSYRYAQGRADRGLVLLGLVPIPAALLLIAGLAASSASLVSSGGRAVGTFSHPNGAAAFFSISALVAVGIAYSLRSRLWLIGGCLSLIALLLTASMGGLLGLLVGLLVFVLLRAGVTSAKKVGLLISLGLVSAIAVNISGVADRLTELEGLDVQGSLGSGESTNSLEWRLINWGEYLEIFRAAPWVGTGAGSTWSEIMPLGAPPHSIFVQFLVEYGISGTFVFLVLFFIIVKYLISRLNHGWPAGLLLSIIALMVVNGSESNLFGYTPAMYYVAAVAGILSVWISADENIQPSRQGVNETIKRTLG